MTLSVNGETTRTTESHAARDVAYRSGCVGVLKAERAELRNAAAGLVFAEKDIAIDRGVARAVVAGGELRLTQCGAGTVVAGGDAAIRQCGAGTIVSLGRVDIAQGGAGCLVARSATVGRGGVVLIAVTPRLEVAEGGRVFGGPVAAIAAIAGIAFGLAFGRLIRVA
jgi:hypothetical protein